MKISCQACRSALVETTVESDELERPYEVCWTCAERLGTRSLRPLGWYNLACSHGQSQYLLHDDFYDDDGAACQPEGDVVDAELFPAPTLEAVSGDIEGLLDYVSTRRIIEGPVIEALSCHNHESILRSLQMRLASKPSLEVRSIAYEICARVLGRTAEGWVREEWKSFSPTLLFDLAQASAACLPSQEGYGLVLNALTGVPSKDLVRAAAALSWFRSAATLDWLDHNVSYPFVDDWGRVAAMSHLTWERVAKWLAFGRPLSLVALDALLACWHYSTPILNQFAPKLLAPAPVKEMTTVLERYLISDPVPRVRKGIASIVGNWEQICEPRPDI